jgi:hypothetical protein
MAGTGSEGMSAVGTKARGPPMGSQSPGLIFSRMLYTLCRYFKILPPLRIFFLKTDASTFSRLISAIAVPRLLSESPEYASGLTGPSSSEG